MAKDSSLRVRKAVVASLKADASVAALVADRVFGPNPPAAPTWPFVRYGTPTAVPMRATGMDGSRIRVDVHAFAKGDDETDASALAEACAAVLDGAALRLGGTYAATAHLHWLGNQIVRDSDEATGWHGIVSLEARVAS